jgi:hypothetical protein
MSFLKDFSGRTSRAASVRAAFALMLVVGAPSVVAAQQTVGASINVTAVIGSRVHVSFDRSSVSFDTTAFDPGSVVPISAAPLTVVAKARVPDRTQVELTVQADGPLRAGTNTIPESTISWTGTGTGFRNNGTASANNARVVGRWRGPGIYSGVQTYQFTDSWTYTVGAYTLILNYTLSAP